MIQTRSTVVAPMTKICNSLTRNFAYELSDKKASKNLLKAASKDPFAVIEHQKCTVFELSVGAYMEVVFPLLSQWKGNKFTEASISVESLTPGLDDKGKHIDTLINLKFNGESVTLCCYNTTQKIKIEGKGYLKFSQYLKKLLEEGIAKVSSQIDNYNKSVIAALSGKRKSIARPIRNVRYKAMNISQLSILRKQAKSPGLPLVDDLSLMDLSAEHDSVLEVEDQGRSDSPPTVNVTDLNALETNKVTARNN